MHRSTYAGALAVVSCLVAACAEPNAPAVSEAVASRASGAHTAGQHGRGGARQHLVQMMDACDPTTFDAVVGPGTCLRSGGVTFDEFIAQLTKHGFAGAWHFAPPRVEARPGETLVARNRGGEVHTFTHVASFGGGILPDLNALSHNPVEAQECKDLDDDDFVPPGGTYTESVDEGGTMNFQCCIHPWMRTVVRVKGS